MVEIATILFAWVFIGALLTVTMPDMPMDKVVAWPIELVKFIIKIFIFIGLSLYRSLTTWE